MKSCNKKFKIDIIGAGISGMATAYYLDKLVSNIKIRIWEKDKTPGGLAGNFQTEHFSVEKFYHHIFKRDKALQKLINEIGLGDDLNWRSASTGAYYSDRPFRLSSPIDLLRFKPLSFLDRIRFGLIVLHARTVKDWKKLDNISAKEYIIKYAGTGVYKTVWKPLLKGKFGPYAEDVSAAWLWCKLVDRGGSRAKSGFEQLGYLKGGLGRMFNRIVEILDTEGHDIYLNNPITKIELEGNHFVKAIRTKDERIESDFVVCCTQVPEFVDILPDSLKNYKDLLSKILFLSNVCLVLTLNKSLSDFYWTNVTDSPAPFVGIIEQTQWADIEDFANQHLVYISAYVVNDDPRLNMEPKDLLNHYLPYIKKMFPDFTEHIVLEAVKWTAPYTQPIVHTGYRHSVPSIQTPIDNLLLCTMAQIYPNDRQVSNGVEMALKIVNRIKGLSDF